ncbi:MAG: molybdopterin-dependent oxidoreductase [Candidatus Dormibacteraeota bacterium]|nr:molybdopterin-dependent oxidoreductase [Candidatus Dormibacteraeota bacterium]MBO0759799.1 molybdopterin-dependent oxidoreductase [Candidatus Dormibacteraeota bacterium]
MAKTAIHLDVNGTLYDLLAEPDRSLVDALRDDLGLTGTKRACNEGECASCAVHLDGTVVNACLVLAVEAQGHRITTIEGLAQNGELDPVQRAFAEHFASQCGYCTPGMIMTAKGLLAMNPRPSEAEVRQAIRGNLCRCTGYTKIVDAIMAASGQPRPRQDPPSPYRVVGRSVPRTDALEKVTGRAAYAYDVRLPGMVYGEILRSPHPHARILGIETSQAEAMPGVLAILTQKDMPSARFGAFVQDETALADGVVRYVGEGVAAAIAVDEPTALAAIRAIQVEYEPLPGVFDPEQAMEEGAPPVHEGVERNVAAHNRVIGGDVEAGFAEADLVFEDRFVTGRQCHACLEPHAVVADYDASGRVTLHMSSQSTFFDRFGLMGIFGLPANKIRIISPYLGGGFGSKSEPHSIYVVAIQASMKLGRPVKMFHSRDEEFTSSRTRHPEIIDIRTGVKQDGTITARSARVLLDNGAYTSYGPGVSLTQSMLGGAVYRLPAYRYDGFTVYTNNPFGGAFRGFGSPQFTFAAECHTDMIAERLDMDPVEFRRRNLSRPGDKAISGPTLTSCGIADCMEQAAAAIGWEEKRRNPRPGRGVGLACGVHFTSGKFHPNVNADFCAAGVKVNEDGSVSLLIGATEMGTGAATTATAQICAEELGVDLDDVDVVTSDSETIPADFGTYGSRVTTLAGNAVRDACAQVRAQLFRVAGESLGAQPDELELGHKSVRVKGQPERSLDLAATVQSSLFRDREGRQIMAQAHYDAPCSLPDPETGVGDFAMSYSFGVHAVEIQVDEETGHVEVVDLVAATDCGNVVNPALAEAQVEGGAAQGIGYGLLEDLVCEDGMVRNPNFAMYKIPTATEMPPIRSIWVQTDDPRGPYGAKGLGEMGLVPTAPAIANAVYDATGARVTRIPLTPERVLDALRSSRERQGV